MTVPPPDMSYFIASMFSPGFSEMPPVSNVTPLPTSARSSPFLPVDLAGVYRRTIIFAGCSEPIETLISEPMPILVIWASVRISHLRPTSFAIFAARLAISVGVRIFGGSLARSRVKFIESPITSPRAMPVFRSPGFAPSIQTVKDVTALSILSLVLYLSISNWLVINA